MSKKIGEKLSNCEAAFTIFKAFVGVGSLSTPYFAYMTGWALNPIMIISSLVLTLYCVKLLVECADTLKADSIPKIAEATFGKKAKVLTDCLIVGS